MTRKHTRIIQHDFANLIRAARLDAFRIEQHNMRRDLILDIHACERTTVTPFERDNKLFVSVDGFYFPARLTFRYMRDFDCPDFFLQLDSYPTDDAARIIGDILSFQYINADDGYYILGMRGRVDADLLFFARSVKYEVLGNKFPVRFEFDWSPPPPQPAGIVPMPRRLHTLFGGDPIAVRLDSKIQTRRLFIGGIEYQNNARPSNIGIVLNLGEEPSAWTVNDVAHPHDRWDNKGEGSQGMSVEVIRAEAEWVIARLQQNERVLVHCVAGMNRSATICTAVVMLLEGLPAEAALARVREHHPWARPDSNHWLKLLWLEKLERAK